MEKLATEDVPCQYFNGHQDSGPVQDSQRHRLNAIGHGYILALTVKLRNAVAVRGNTAAYGPFAVLHSDIVREIQPCAKKNFGEKSEG